MTLTSKIFLDKRHTKKDGTQPLKLRITISRKSIEIPMGYSFPPKYWDEKNFRVRPNCPLVQNVTRLNNLLKKKHAEAIEKLIQIQDDGELEKMSLAEIKARITGKSTSNTHLLAFFNTIITELEITGKVGNARVYKMSRDSISHFIGSRDIPMKRVNYRWLKAYETWFLSKGNSINGLSVNLRTLRALINRAIKRKAFPKDAYPFDTYSIKREASKKRAIKQTGIKEIMAYEPRTKRQERAKDYFLISYYLMGASFVDLAFLKVQDIKVGRVEYKRKKTGRLHSIKITPPLQAILDKYLKGKGANDYILNVVKNKASRDLVETADFNGQEIKYSFFGNQDEFEIKVNEELKNHIYEYPKGRKRENFLIGLAVNEQVKKQYTSIRTEIKRVNDSLQEIADALGIDFRLTTYVARHSFATIAKYKDVPIPIISQALGHTDVKTTETYLSEFDNETMDRFHEMIIE